MPAMTLAQPVRIELAEQASLLDREFAEPRVNGLTRSQITARIIAMNQTASIEFLDQFDIEELSNYLEHLNSAAQPRGRWARRVVQPGTCCISWSARRF